jgi:hypothetical protein
LDIQLAMGLVNLETDAFLLFVGCQMVLPAGFHLSLGFFIVEAASLQLQMLTFKEAFC